MTIAVLLVAMLAGCLQEDPGSSPSPTAPSGSPDAEHRSGMDEPSVNVTESTYWSGQTTLVTGPAGSPLGVSSTYEETLTGPLHLVLVATRWTSSSPETGSFRLTLYPTSECEGAAQADCLGFGTDAPSTTNAYTLQEPGQLELTSQDLESAGCAENCSWSFVFHGGPVSGQHAYELAVTQFRIPPNEDYNPETVNGLPDS